MPPKVKSSKTSKTKIASMISDNCYLRLEDLSETAQLTDSTDLYKGPGCLYHTWDMDPELKKEKDDDGKLMYRAPFKFSDNAKQLVDFTYVALQQDLTSFGLGANDSVSKLDDILESGDTDSSMLAYLHNLKYPAFGDNLAKVVDTECFIRSGLRNHNTAMTDDMLNYIEGLYHRYLKHIAYTFGSYWWTSAFNTLDEQFMRSYLLSNGIKFELLQRITKDIKRPVKSAPKNEQEEPDEELPTELKEEVTKLLGNKADDALKTIANKVKRTKVAEKKAAEKAAKLINKDTKNKQDIAKQDIAKQDIATAINRI